MMNTTNTALRVLELEKDLAEFAPQVRKGLLRIDGPSERVLQAIHDKAVEQVFARRRSRRFIPLFRSLAAAAALTLLLGGAIQTHLARQAVAHAQTVSLLLHIGAPQASAGPAQDTPELANRLLNIQGLDEEAYFTPDETEVLWL